MLPYALFGATFAFSAAVQPGPFQAYLVSLATAHGLRRTLPAVFAPIVSDIPVACLALFALTRLPASWLGWLRAAGGVFLLYLAWGAFRAFRNFRETGAPPPLNAGRTFIEAVAVNLLNPNPYISWSLVLGPLLVRAWDEAGSHAAALVVAFYGTFVAANVALLGVLAGARSLGPRVGRILIGLSAAALAGFGCYQLWTARGVW